LVKTNGKRGIGEHFDFDLNFVFDSNGMIPDIRRAYNTAFTDDAYKAFLDYIGKAYNNVPNFRVAETPVFIPHALKEHLFRACDEITNTICRPDYKALTQSALQDKYEVPGEDAHATFLVMDFGVTVKENGELWPMLIEVQGFPSLYFYQHLAAKAYRKFFHIPEQMDHLCNGLNEERYLELLRRVIVGDEDPKQVVLLEVEPWKQNTQIDFHGTRHHLGIHVACITEVYQRDGRAYYKDESGKEIRIRRIYNRVIYDELIQRKDLEIQFKFTRDCDVEWVGHPNWFFRISKYTLPFIESSYAPRTWFLSQMHEIPPDLDHFVLKPLYSFSGTGVKLHIAKHDLDLVTDPTQYILQERVKYHPVIETLDEPAKVELRMMMIWEKDAARPVIVNNLARLSKGEMIGVKYNKDKTWVGGSVGFFE
jgi:hypothetical protein